MNEIEALWQDSSHLGVSIPDTLIISEKEVKDWLYTSSKGQVMKHKRQSISLWRILEAFRSDLEFYAFYVSESKSVFLNSQDFELTLLSISDKTCESSFILQKYIRLDNKATVSADFTSENVAISKGEIENCQEVLGNSKRVLQYLKFNLPDLESGSFHWVFSDKNLFIVKVVLVRKRVEKKIRCSSARTRNTNQLNNIRGRPVTASHRRDSVSSARSFVIAKKENIETAVQTNPLDPCDCCSEYRYLVSQLSDILQENADLEKKIKKTEEKHKIRRSQLEEKWKEKSLEISKEVSDKLSGL